MQKRVLALALPLGLAACGEAPLAPEAPPPPSALLAADAAPSASAVVLSDVRLSDLTAALADARERLLPAVSGQEDADPTALQAALQLLDGELAAGDAAGVLAAVAEAGAALDALPADESGAYLPEVDAMRLALEEIRLSAGGAAQ